VIFITSTKTKCEGYNRCTPTLCRDFFHRFNFTFKAFLNLPYRVKAMTAVAAAGKGRVDAVKVARAQESRVLYVIQNLIIVGGTVQLCVRL
jgi:hypothetical protein